VNTQITFGWSSSGAKEKHARDHDDISLKKKQNKTCFSN